MLDTLRRDPIVVEAIEKLRSDDRVVVRRAGEPDAGGKCVVYWMQHAQRAEDNPALDVAVRLGNEIGKPVVVFFAPVPFYPNAIFATIVSWRMESHTSLKG